jgi:hypothetical protein
MASWFLSLITPALIASIVSIAVNIRSDKIRAERDYSTGQFSGTRELIDAAVRAAAEYYPLGVADRTPILEAKLWLADRELRFALPSLMAFAGEDLKDELDALTRAFDDLIAELTGGSFQSASAAPDLIHVRRIASAGAELRARLTDLRHAELRRSVDRDLVSRLISYATAQKGISPREIRG